MRRDSPAGLGARVVAERYRREVARLRAAWPTRLISLAEALEDPRPVIPLADGTLHEIDREHLEKMASRIPRILWGVATLPILLRYERDGSGRARYVVVGDDWQKRIVGLLVHGELRADGARELEVSEARVLLTHYRSLVFVGLNL